MPDTADHRADMYMTFIEKRDAIVAEQTPDDFDYWWDQLYDVADVDRVWIST